MQLGYGSYVRSGPEAAATLRDEVRLAEDAGFDAMFFSEHHGVAGYPPDPLLVSAMALAQTSRLRAGPMPMLLPLHDPVRVAERAALADLISGGRLIMGLGAGYLKADFDQAEVPLKGRGRRLEDGIRILRRVWLGELEAYHGSVLSHPELQPLVHAPTQPGGPAIWNAGASAAGVRRAAELADGLVIDSLRPTDEVTELVRLYRQQCVELDRPAGTAVAMRRLWFGDRQEVDGFLDGFERELRRYVELVGEDQAPWVNDLRQRGLDRAAVEERVFAGAPEAVADDLTAWCGATGVDYVIVKLQWMGTDRDLRPQLERAAAFCEAARRKRQPTTSNIGAQP